MISRGQESLENLENLKFDLFESKDILLDDLYKPDKKFYINIRAAGTQYYFPSKLFSLSEKLQNIRKIFQWFILTLTTTCPLQKQFLVKILFFEKFNSTCLVLRDRQSHCRKIVT